MKITIPEKNRKQIANAILGLVTALILLGANIAGQAVYQWLGLGEMPEDPMVSMGTTHFTAIQVEDLVATDDVYVTDDLNVVDDLTVTGDSLLVNIDSSGYMDFNGGIKVLGDTIGDMDGFGASTITTDTTYQLMELYDATPIMTGGTNSMIGLNIDLAIGNSTAGTNSVYGILVDGISPDAQNTEKGISVGSGWDIAADFDAGVTIDGGVTNIGGGTPGVAAGDNDLYVTADLEVDGVLEVAGSYPLYYSADNTEIVCGSATISSTLEVSHGLTTPLYGICTLEDDPDDDAGDLMICSVDISGATVTLKGWQDDLTAGANDTSVFWCVIGTQ